MQLLITKKYTEDFAFNYLPLVMYNIIKEKYLKGIYKHYDLYLKNILGIKYTFLDIVRDAIKYIYCSYENTFYLLEIGSVNIFKDTSYTIKQLVDLIEFGNLEIKGTHIFTKTFNVIRNACDVLYKVRYNGGA